MIFAGDLTLLAGNDLSARAAHVNSEQGTLSASAARDIDITTGTSQSHLEGYNKSSSKGFLSSKSTTEYRTSDSRTNSSSTFSGEAVQISAGRDLAITGSNVVSTHATQLAAGRDITIEAVTDTHAATYLRKESRSGLSASVQGGISYGKASARQDQAADSATSVGSNILGENVRIDAERDVTLTGSAVIADRDVTVVAGRDIDIDSARERTQTTATSKSSSTGIGLAPSLSGNFTLYSKASAMEEGNSRTDTARTSLLSANSGDLTLIAGTGAAGGNFSATGADLLAGERLTIEADRIDLLAERNTSSSRSRAESKSFTIGARPAGTVGGLLHQSAERAIAATEGTGNDRLDAALALKAGYDAYKLLDNAQAYSRQVGEAANAGVEEARNQGGALFGIQVGIGSSKSKSSSATDDTQVFGTSLQAQEIDLLARQSDLHMEAAKVQAADITLSAARDVLLEAAANTSSVRQDNKSSGVSLGVTAGFGEQSGISFQLGAQNAKGRANGSQTLWDNTLVTATDRLTITSGADTTLRGAQLAARQATLDVGRNLTIQTLQDRSQFQSKQESGGFGVSLCIPPICYGVSSVSVNAAEQSIKHDYRSAQGQSGIAAGADGFDINVGSHTDLVGAAITSTADSAKNTLTTASLSSRDLVNAQSTESRSRSFSASGSFGSGAAGGLSQLTSNAAANVLGNLAGQAGLPKDGSARSTTQSVIGPATIDITGTGDAEQDAQSRATADELQGRDAQTANQRLTNTLTLQQGLELEKELQRVRENQYAAQLVGSVMANAIGDIAHAQTKDYESAQAKKNAYEYALASETDPAARAQLLDGIAQAESVIAANQDQYDLWKEGGAAKIALHGLSGYLQGRLSGGAGTAAAFASMSNEALTALVNQTIAESLQDQFAPAPGDTAEQLQDKAAALARTQKEYGEAAAILIGTLAGALIDDIPGGAQGASAALIAEQYNRQLHESELQKIQRLAAIFAAAESISPEEAEARLTRQALKMVDLHWNESLSGNDDSAIRFLVANSEDFSVGADTYRQFRARGIDEYRNSMLFADTLATYSSQYLAASQQPATAPTFSQALQRGASSTAGLLLGGWDVLREGAEGVVDLAKLREGLKSDDPEAMGQVDAMSRAIVGYLGGTPVEDAKQYLADQLDRATMLRAQGELAEAARIETGIALGVAAVASGVGAVGRETAQLAKNVAEAAARKAASGNAAVIGIGVFNRTAVEQQLIDSLGSIKSNPTRLEYEQKVADLSSYAERI